MIDPNQAVAALLFAHPECAPVLQRHRIAAASADGRSVAQACRERGLDVARVVDELERAIADESALASVDPTSLSDADLVHHIVTRYHDRVRQLLPFLRGLSAKVAHVHGARHPELRTLVQFIHELDEVLWSHLDDEEACLFLAVRSGQTNQALLQELLTVMTGDHAAIRTLLGRVHEAAEEYRVPEGACASYRLLFTELERLERDLRSHLWLEDEVLLPRLVAA
jgi:regulator of cell morphogenesis and NO signaling